MVGEPQVVVRREAQDLAAVHDADRALGRAHDPQGPVQALLAELCDLVGEEGERVLPGVLGDHHALQSMMTLPEAPERAAAKAASNSRNGKRWVIAGRMSRPDCTITVILYQVSYISRP